MSSRLKDWRRVAVRYDRCPTAFFSAIALAATAIRWLRSTSPDPQSGIPLAPTVDLDPGRRATPLTTAIDASVTAGVRHVVLMTAAGTEEADQATLGASYWHDEQHLIATALAWTILRMGYYAEALAGGARVARRRRLRRADREPRRFRLA